MRLKDNHRLYTQRFIPLGRKDKKMRQGKIVQRLLVTTALPYANGPLHLGHILECVQADIWVRFHRLQGSHCVFISGVDAHGTPVMLSAERQGITAAQFCQKMHGLHQADCLAFGVKYDRFYTTHSEENRRLIEDLYQRLLQNGDIVERSIEQAYDAEKAMFLPDRFIKGQCPRCSADDQYGDNCEACGAVYSSEQLRNPVSVLSGTTPQTKRSRHYFFALKRYTQLLQNWIRDNEVQPQVVHKLHEWFETGLKSWDISRDAPYFGFEIPNAPGKYFYVWMDAPVGYMASFKHLCGDGNDLQFDDYWKPGSAVKLYHFIGKDIIYFHTLFWPAMLAAANYRLPSAVYAHGFLTVNGQKMSKSRGTFITAQQYLKHFDPEYLRYYLAAKLGNGIDDIDLNWDDFMQRVNTDLVGKLVNIASRCAPFIENKFAGKLSSTVRDPLLYAQFVTAATDIAAHYQARAYNCALRLIRGLADSANQYIDAEKPWVLAKKNANDPTVQHICSMGLNLFRLLILYLKPVVPQLAHRSEKFLNIAPLMWSDAETALCNHTIAPFRRLLDRIEKQKIQQLQQQVEDDYAEQTSRTK